MSKDIEDLNPQDIHDDYIIKNDVNLNPIKKTDIENLSIITMGSMPPNPSELLASAKSKVVIQMLKNKFDYIIFDGTPVTGLTDSIIMASLVDKVVIVSSIGDINVEILENTKQALSNVNANIAGVIANKTPLVNSNYYGYYGDK